MREGIVLISYWGGEGTWTKRQLTQTTQNHVWKRFERRLNKRRKTCFLLTIYLKQKISIKKKKIAKENKTVEEK